MTGKEIIESILRDKDNLDREIQLEILEQNLTTKHISIFPVKEEGIIVIQGRKFNNQ